MLDKSYAIAHPPKKFALLGEPINFPVEANPSGAQVFRLSAFFHSLKTIRASAVEAGKTILPGPQGAMLFDEEGVAGAGAGAGLGEVGGTTFGSNGLELLPSSGHTPK
jgi:hypothetical protein